MRIIEDNIDKISLDEWEDGTHIWEVMLPEIRKHLGGEPSIFDGIQYKHTPVVVSVRHPITPETILLAAHSEDADNRPLSTYPYESVRYIHIPGFYKP